MKTKILLGLVAILTVFGCKDSFDNFDPDPKNPIETPVIVEFNASAFVEVVNSDGEPIEDASINLGTLSVPTNEYGVAYLKDVEMGSITYLSVDKPGYFHGSRRFYPSEGTTSYLRVMLLDEVLMGDFESGQGGVVSDADLRLEFPSNGIVDINGNPYSGTVNVYAAGLVADDEHLSDKMPGDLVGQTLTGAFEALASFGMAAVELRSPSGEALQVADQSTVEMSIDVPASLAGVAPATIPMWSFDETEGVWKEEGVGRLEGNRYTADIPHFSWWNWDVPYPLVKFGASFVFENGAPATQLYVCFSSDDAGTRCGATNDEGAICGYIPQGEVMLLEVKNPCGEVIYSLEIGPYSDSTTIGPITLPETTITTTSISGNAVNCDGDPVTDGYVRVFTGSLQLWLALDENGAFEGEFINCDEGDVTINVIDEAALKQSLPQTYPYGINIDAGTVTVCEDVTEIITLEIPELDTTYSWLFAYADVNTAQGFTVISAQDSSGNGGFFYLAFDGDDVGTYAGEGEIFVIANDNTGGGNVTLFAGGGVTVTVTYFGDQGDVVTGTFEGELEGLQTGPTPFNGSFTARRY